MLVLNVHHHNPDKPVPNWAKNILFRCLATLTFKRKDVEELRIQTTTKVIQVQPSSCDTSKTELSITSGGSPIGASPIHEHTSPGIMSFQRPFQNSASTPNMEIPFSKMAFLLPPVPETEEPPSGQFANSWRLAGEILDRFFFMTFLLITVVSSLVVLIIIPLSLG